MFYIKHNSDSFSVIDCCLSEENKGRIIQEIKKESSEKGIFRFISTHPDNDHILGLDYLNQELNILNFYCVKNKINKEENTIDFKKYCELRDSEKTFSLEKSCKRKWLNENDESRGSAGLDFWWPITTNKDFQNALSQSINGKNDNNICPIFKYSIENGNSTLWMGDIETEFMEKIANDIESSHVDILFAPHHSRKSGRVPSVLLDKIKPRIIIVGEAPSEDLEYYQGFNTITQNTAGDITIDCESKKVHFYVSNKDYCVDYLDNEKMNNYNYYLVTLNL